MAQFDINLYARVVERYGKGPIFDYDLFRDLVHLHFTPVRWPTGQLVSTSCYSFLPALAFLRLLRAGKKASESVSLRPREKQKKESLKAIPFIFNMVFTNRRRSVIAV